MAQHGNTRPSRPAGGGSGLLQRLIGPFQRAGRGAPLILADAMAREMGHLVLGVLLAPVVAAVLLGRSWRRALFGKRNK